MRKAEPYIGKNDSGMEFPLLKDTEVVLSFVNGDPDRPIIIGAVPNANTPSVVTKSNQTRNRIKTTSEVLFEIEDGSAPSGRRETRRISFACRRPEPLRAICGSAFRRMAMPLRLLPRDRRRHGAPGSRR